MKKISLGIPFYNSSKYFLDCIKYSIDDDFIGEIIVNDDNSTSEEWENLNGIISNLDSSKIKVYKNEKNLGGFKNKFMTISKCSLEWVYLIDSDNSVCEDTLTTIEEKIDWDNNTCYCP
ncbi:MAG: glycosyltransferase, partial [Candidatus Fonsibacter ubiquis]